MRQARWENASIAYILMLSISVVALRRQHVKAMPSRAPLFITPSTATKKLSKSTVLLSSITRGGALEESDDEYDFDESDTEEEYDSEDDEDIKLSASAIAATRKAKSKEVKLSRKTVNNSLKKKASKKRPSPLKKVPYIVRALMNPFTVIAMTKMYFASLFNIDYMKQDTTQDLRSALQEKAKKAGSSGGKRARKMKPGQAKTLSDLPVLNA